MLGLPDAHGGDYFRESVAQIIAEQKKLEQVRKTTDIQVNYVSIYKIFRELATESTREQTEGL